MGEENGKQESIKKSCIQFYLCYLVVFVILLFKINFRIFT